MFNHKPIFKLLLWFALSIFLYSDDQENLGEIPDFEIRLLNGKKTTIYDLLESGPVLMDFWATWCKPCKKVMKHLDTFQRDFKDQGFQVLTINQDTPRSIGKVKSYINSNKYSFLVGLDPNQQLAKKLNGQLMPNLILVDKKGKIRWRHQGYMPGEEKEIKEQIEILLSKSS